MGHEPCDNGKFQLENESKVININHETKWIFGICDPGTYDFRIFYVKNYRTRGTLLPQVKNSI